MRLDRTRAVVQGRKPKLKKTLELSAPIFIETDNGKLITMNDDNLGLVAKAIGLAEKLA